MLQLSPAPTPRQSLSLALAGLELTIQTRLVLKSWGPLGRKSPASASQMLGLGACPTPLSPEASIEDGSGPEAKLQS